MAPDFHPEPLQRPLHSRRGEPGPRCPDFVPLPLFGEGGAGLGLHRSRCPDPNPIPFFSSTTTTTEPSSTWRTPPPPAPSSRSPARSPTGTTTRSAAPPAAPPALPGWTCRRPLPVGAISRRGRSSPLRVGAVVLAHAASRSALPIVGGDNYQLLGSASVPAKRAETGGDRAAEGERGGRARALGRGGRGRACSSSSLRCPSSA